MPKFIVDLWLDGYETEEEMIAACKEFIYDQLNFSGSGVEIEAAGRIEALIAERDAAVERSREASQYLAIETSHAQQAEARTEDIEAKLAKAVKAFEEIKRYSPCGDSRRKAVDTLAEIKGDAP